MTSKLLYLPIIILFLSLLSCSTEEVSGNGNLNIDLNEVPAPKIIEIEVMERINQYRIERGLNSLGSLDIIRALAYEHTTYMIRVNDVNHDNFYQRKQILEQRANAVIVSENVAYGYNSAESVVNAWLNSEGHRENIEGNYTDFDISAEQDENGKWYFTNIFIKR